MYPINGRATLLCSGWNCQPLYLECFHSRLVIDKRRIEVAGVPSPHVDMTRYHTGATVAWRQGVR